MGHFVAPRVGRVGPAAYDTCTVKRDASIAVCARCLDNRQYDSLSVSLAALDRMDRQMNEEKIQVRVTSSGQMLDVVVLNKRLDMIQVVLGEGVHNVRCDLIPTRNGTAYVGNAMGREIVYERSREAVKADLARIAGFRDFRR